MPTVEQTVDVNVAVTAAYDQWTRFDSFPRWMEGVASVDRIGGDRLHWVAKIREEFAATEGETRSWVARITEQTPDRRVSWETVGGPADRSPDWGAASFEPLGASACRVTFAMSWEPDDAVETPEGVLVAVSQVVAADLARFKAYIEARGEEDAGIPEQRLAS
jgi:uncharacterized membrane protein